jgi:hypothetical protein
MSIDLFISRAIVERHRARLWAEPKARAGKGWRQGDIQLVETGKRLWLKIQHRRRLPGYVGHHRLRPAKPRRRYRQRDRVRAVSQ